MRTFIALDLPPDFADDAAALARRLSASMEGRFLKRDTYHLTLAFLGEVDEAQAARAATRSTPVCANTAPVVLGERRSGKFAAQATRRSGSASPPNRELEDLAERLARRAWLPKRPLRREALQAAHHPRPPRPHPQGEPAAARLPRDDRACTATLYKSTLERTGAVYKPLHSARLDG